METSGSEHTVPDLAKSQELKGECPFCSKEYNAISWTHRGCDGIDERLYAELNKPQRADVIFRCIACRKEGEPRFAETGKGPLDDLNAMVVNMEQPVGAKVKPVAEAWKPPPDLFSTLWGIVSWYGSRPFLGTRMLNDDGKRPYVWITYEQAWLEASALGAGLMHLQLMNPGEYLGIFSINRKEWVLTDMACVQYNFVSVPLVVTLDDETLIFILNQSELRCVIAAPDLACKIVRVADKCPLLRGIVVMGEDLPDESSPKLLMYRWGNVTEAGDSNFPGDYPGRQRKPNDLMTIIYTSGSTGMPKGAMMTDQRWNHFCTRGYLMPDPIRLLSFAPLGHVSERQLCWLAAFYGGMYGFFSGDMALIFEDFSELNPTYVSAPPRLFNAVYAEYKEAVEAHLAKEPGTERWRAELLLLDRFRGVFGNALQFLVTGSAPTSEVVKQFLRRCFAVPLYDGFGTTEAGGIATDGVISRDVKVHLLDVPELGYRTTDKPYPRGEICVHTDVMIDGYFKNPGKTEESFIVIDGLRYFRTGDIGFKRLDYQVEIIDRVKNVFKLAQGEFVTPSKIESALEKSVFVSQICVVGAPKKCPEFVVAVVVPAFEVCQRSFPSCSSTVELVSRERGALEQLMLADFRKIANVSQLLQFECPARIVFSAEAFTSENDMLTPSMKVKRGPIETRFHREIEEAAESAAALSGSNPSTSSGVLDESFLLQGGDSLSAVKLVSRIKRELGADVPASFLLQNPTLADLRAYVASSSALFVPTLPAAAVADLALDARQHLGPERGTSCSLLSEAKCVLLTGATGFLGAFLLRDLLAALPSATVICAAVRGGETRLREALKFRGIRIGQDDWKRVEVLAGDLASGLIGCEEPKQFAKLARRVDAVFHSAASVNWMRSYEALRNDNVAPCFDLIRFCTTAKLKRLVHISTVSCSPARLSRDGQEYFEGFGDDAWIANSGPYAQTKYVAEKIFLSCASEFPISIFRPANILADSVSGSANVTDFSNRLVACSVLLNAAISEAEVVSNFTPVDYVSSAIVRVASHPKVHLGPFLLTNNNSPSLAVIADAIVAEFPSVRRLSYLDFRRLLLEHPHPEQLPLFGLLPLFQSTRPFMQDSISWSDCTNTWALVEECPKTTAVHLKKWISFLRGQRVV